MITAKAQKNKKIPQKHKKIIFLLATCYLSRMETLKKSIFGISVCLFVVILLSGLLTTCSSAQELTIKDLIENAKEYDGKTVSVEAEAIGDIIKANKGVWININDKTAAIGVFCPESLIKDITYLGNYKTRGDWIRIKGVFHRACPLHGADIDIHARQITKISQGRLVREDVPADKKRLAVYLSGALLCLLILQSYKMRRLKKSKG